MQGPQSCDSQGRDRGIKLLLKGRMNREDFLYSNSCIHWIITKHHYTVAWGPFLPPLKKSLQRWFFFLLFLMFLSPVSCSSCDVHIRPHQSVTYWGQCLQKASLRARGSASFSYLSSAHHRGVVRSPTHLNLLFVREQPIRRESI